MLLPFLRRGKSLDMDLIIDHAKVRRPPWKPSGMGFRLLSGWGTHREGDPSQLHGDRSSWAQDPPTLHPDLLIWYFSIFFNKLVSLSVFLSSVSCSSKVTKHEERVGRTSDLQPTWTEVVGNWGPFYMWLAFEVGGAVSWDWALTLWEGMLAPGRKVIKWSSTVWHPAGVTELLAGGDAPQLVSDVLWASLRVREKETHKREKTEFSPLHTFFSFKTNLWKCNIHP